jgi:CRP/FNR family transcriptional regulator
MESTVASGRASASHKRDILSTIPFFKGAPPDLQSVIVAVATVVHLKTGEYFLREGDSCAHFAIVVSGKMRVFKLGESGQEITLYHVGSGENSTLSSWTGTPHCWSW